MSKSFKAIISFLLTISIMITSGISALAVGDEEYLCELRLVYAEDYNEARAILDDGEFFEYEIYDMNLNEGTDKIGVFLAYKTTEDIEDAITDIAVMQMNGGYEEGNYQEMIQKSEAEYLAMAQIYKQAIDHWKKAYNADNFLAKAVYRQLNFYTVIDNESSYNGKLLGDIFLGNVDQYELATMFFQGNSYALDNIRSLISMGVAYDYENDKYYLDKVKDEVAAFEADKNCYDEREENFDNLAKLVAPSIKIFRDMFEELSAHEDELNYEDDEYTSTELQYMEYAALAKMMKNVNYLGGKTLYQFCCDYEFVENVDEEVEVDYTNLYPLVGALNPGQLAMTKAFRYYDVVRYGLGIIPEQTMTSEIDAMEEKYKDNPFDIYTGVDRSIYDGTFAITSAAYRADAYTEGGLAEHLFGETLVSTSLSIASGTLGAVLLGTALKLTEVVSAANAARAEALAQAIKSAIDQHVTNALAPLGNMILPGNGGLVTYEQMATTLLTKYSGMQSGAINALTFADKVTQLDLISGKILQSSSVADRVNLEFIQLERTVIKKKAMFSSNEVSEQATQQFVAENGAGYGIGTNIGLGALYIVGGAMMIYSAISLTLSIISYYNPDYDDVPVAMVDLVDTDDGDRYIKYDAVLEAEAREGGEYIPGDTNAYTAHRWNALYYTKSYEAGKPLLAEFDFSYDNNTPEEGFAPIHCFGDLISFDLNRYHIDDSQPIYLSVEQSENQKSAVADVPELVGSIFSTGWVIFAASVGALIGIGCTIGTQAMLRKKKNIIKK